MSAVAFAMTIHGLMEYDEDCQMAGKKERSTRIQSYLEWFCKENEVKDKKAFEEKTKEE